MSRSELKLSNTENCISSENDNNSNRSNREILGDSIFAYIRGERFCEGLHETTQKQLFSSIDKEFGKNNKLENKGLRFHLSNLSKEMEKNPSMIMHALWMYKKNKNYNTEVNKYIQLSNNVLTLTYKSIIDNVLAYIDWNNISRYCKSVSEIYEGHGSEFDLSDCPILNL